MSITTEEQRHQLEAAGWKLAEDTEFIKKWHHIGTDLTLRLYVRMGIEISFWAATPYQGYLNAEEMPLLLGALSILQIPIPGYKIIREEGESGAGHSARIDS